MVLLTETEKASKVFVLTKDLADLEMRKREQAKTINEMIKDVKSEIKAILVEEKQEAPKSL